MTLVVSEISRVGIIMVGDSAVTTPGGVSGGAVKVQYSERANIGFAMWGDGRIGNEDLDRWLATFIGEEIDAGDSVEAVGQRLAHAQNEVLNCCGRTWDEMDRGIHIAGYRNGLPVLFHVHCGHVAGVRGELQLYKDYPDAQGLTDEKFRDYLESGLGCQLRNGYYRHFAPLFHQISGYSEWLKQELNINFPYPGLEGRLDFYMTLVRFVAGILVASREDEGVNAVLSAVAFNAHGIVRNEILPFGPIGSALGGGYRHFAVT